MKIQIDKEVPASMQNKKKWLSNRRLFLKTMLAGAVLTQVPWWTSCKQETKNAKTFVFSNHQLEILNLVQDFLFPLDGNGPGASEIKAAEYLQWVVLDPEMDKEEIDYIFNGIKWVEETAQEEKNSSFLQLKEKEQEEILVFIAAQSWGESWYSVLLTFIFEALLSDPIYGSNPDNIGWKWLNHNPGNPRPDENQKYGKILSYVNSIKQS